MDARLEYMKRHREQGLCRMCSKPLFKGGRCKEHYERHQAARRRPVVVACCGLAGRLKVQYERALKKIVESPEATVRERAKAEFELSLLNAVELLNTDQRAEGEAMLRALLARPENAAFVGETEERA